MSVIVPTYRRPQRLAACLQALANSMGSSCEVLIVCRSDDRESIELAGAEVHHLKSRPVMVSETGVIAAMNAGLAAATGEIIALTDDDAAPWPDWLRRIESAFNADLKLGAIGGKDWQYYGTPFQLLDGVERRAGELQWWGRIIGDHHFATPGPPREVAVIKGVNCAFRADALRQVGGFDTRLQGTGAQVHWELSIGLKLKRAGWKIVFDPSIGVDHFPAARFDEDRRGTFNSLAQSNAVYNETLVLTEHFQGPQRLVFLAWAAFVGTRGAPGLIQVPRLILLRQSAVLRRWAATIRGRIQGARDGWRAGRSEKSLINVADVDVRGKLPVET